jgi:hypothetical protein
MKRRSRAGGKPAKVRRRSALKPKGRSAPKAMPRRGSAPAGQETEVARLTRERDEALEQQTATSEVLRVIASSPIEIQPVLDAIATTAARLLNVADAYIMGAVASCVGIRCDAISGISRVPGQAARSIG